MLGFKQYISKNKEKSSNCRIGFSSIHSDDDSDKHLSSESTDKSKQETQPMKEDKYVHPYEHAVNSLIHEEKDAHVLGLINMHSKNERPSYVKAREIVKNRIKPLEHHVDLNYAEKHIKGYEIYSSLNSPLNQYTGGSAHINSHLIAKAQKKAGIVPAVTDYPKTPTSKFTRMSREIHKSTNHKMNALTNPTIVHSGVGPNMAKVLEKTKVGDSVHMPAYTSTSLIHKIANTFATSELDRSKTTHTKDPNSLSRDGKMYHLHSSRHFMHFHLPKGYHRGRYVENISQNDGEHEVVLDRDQKFKKVHQHTRHTSTFDGVSSIYHERHIHHHFVPSDEK